MQQLRVYPLIALSDGVIFEKWFVYILLFFSSASLWHIKRSFERGSLLLFFVLWFWPRSPKSSLLVTKDPQGALSLQATGVKFTKHLAVEWTRIPESAIVLSQASVT